MPEAIFCVEAFQSKFPYGFMKSFYETCFWKHWCLSEKCVSNGIDDRICYTRDPKTNYFRKTNPMREINVSSLSQFDP